MDHEVFQKILTAPGRPGEPCIRIPIAVIKKWVEEVLVEHGADTEGFTMDDLDRVVAAFHFGGILTPPPSLN